VEVHREADLVTETRTGRVPRCRSMRRSSSSTRASASRHGSARGGPGPVPEVGLDAALVLVERHGDDVRSALSALYEVFQTLREIGRVQV